MADAVEAFGKDVDQEAPDEFMDRQGHDLVALGAFDPIVLPGEGDFVIVDADQPAVGDGDPMGVAGEIGEYGLRSGERWLRCKVCRPSSHVRGFGLDGFAIGSSI